MYTATLLVGLPASGKSTYVDTLSSITRWIDHPNKEGTLVLSTDWNVMRIADREWNHPDWTYDDAWKAFVGVADKQFFSDLGVAVQKGRNLIVDRTNMSVKSRRRVLETIRQNDKDRRYEINALVFGMQLTAIEWMKRLGNRPGKTIPFTTLQSMAASYEHPDEFEGFHRVTYVS